MEEVRDYNEKYTGEYTSRIAFPIGGLGTGKFPLTSQNVISAEDAIRLARPTLGIPFTVT